MISSTVFPANGHVAGAPSKMGRSLFYETGLITGMFFITTPLHDTDPHRIFES